MRDHQRRDSSLAKAFAGRQQLPPVFHGVDVAFAEAKAFDAVGTVIDGDLPPDHRLQCRQAVDDDGPVFVTVAVQRRDGFHHIANAVGFWEGVHLQVAETVLGADEHRRWCAGRKRRLADAWRAVDHD